MGNETSKTNKLRSEDFFGEFFKYPAIDIGGGSDPCCQDAEIFDINDGDANNILAHRDKSSYMTVYSSHCLEHMFDPVRALSEWWELLKPSGHLVLVVPHEDYYEQHIWPSIFNPDHKHTFNITKTNWSPASHNIKDMVLQLPQAHLISCEIQTDSYDKSLLFPMNKQPKATKGFIYRQINSLAKKVKRLSPVLGRKIDQMMVKIGWPIDQTRRGALAQIQIVARKG